MNGLLATPPEATQPATPFKTKLQSLLISLAMGLFIIQPWSPKIGNVPVQVLFVAFAFMFGVGGVMQLRRQLVVPASILIGIATLSVTARILIEGLDIKFVFHIITGLLIGCCVIHLTVNHLSTLQRASTLFVSFAVLSCGVAILQYSGLANWTWGNTIYAESYNAQRDPTGLEWSPVPFAYAIAPLLTYLILVAISQRTTLWRSCLYGGVISIVFFGLYVSSSRSGMLAVVMASGLGIVALILLGRLPRWLLGVMAASVIVLLFIDIIWLHKLAALSASASGDMRTGGTWSLFMPVILDYPLGIPAELRSIALENKLATTPEALAFKHLFQSSGGYDPHNILLTSAFFWGIPAAIVLLILCLYFPFKGLQTARRFPQHPLTNLLVAAIFANIAFFIHAWFHNSNHFYGEMRIWFWFGLMVALIHKVSTSTDVSTDTPENDPEVTEHAAKKPLFNMI